MMPTQTNTLAFAQLDRAVMEFKQVRAGSGFAGVSWIMADWQLEYLIPRFPERARQILEALDSVPSPPKGGEIRNQQSTSFPQVIGDVQ